MMSIEAGNGNANPPFQKCGSCRRRWNQWPDFILDPDIRLIGLQVFPDLPNANLLVFEHRCGSSISVLAKRLRRILGDPGPEAGLTLLFGTDTCTGHCRLLENLEGCDRPCANACDRRLILALLRMKREGCASAKH